MRRLSRCGLAVLATAALLASSPARAQISCAKLRWDAGATGAEAELGCGSKHGVHVGMTGLLRAGLSGQTPVASFKVVREPDPETAWVAISEAYDSLDPFAEMTATFDQALDPHLRPFSVLSVESATRTAIIDAGCRQGVRDGLQGQVVRRIEDAERVEVTTVATFGVVSTALDTCKVAWLPSGPGHMPVAGASQAIVVGLAAPAEERPPTVVSGNGGLDSRIAISNEGAPIGTRLALVHRAPSGEGDVQYGEAVIESVAGDKATAVIVAPLLGDARLLTSDAVVAYDSPACTGLPLRHWSSEAFAQAQVQTLQSRLVAATTAPAGAPDNTERTLAEVRELRAMLEALAARTQAPITSTPAPPPVPTPRPMGSSVLRATAPEDGDVVRNESVLTWVADDHCSNRDLAVRIEAVTDGGRRVGFQEQVGQGKHGKMQVESVSDRLHGQLKKRERIRGFNWAVINMQPPPKKENCITEERSVVLAVPIEKR